MTVDGILEKRSLVYSQNVFDKETEDMSMPPHLRIIARARLNFYVPREYGSKGKK